MKYPLSALIDEESFCGSPADEQSEVVRFDLEFGPASGDPCTCSLYHHAHMSALGPKPALTPLCSRRAAAGQPPEMVRP